MQYNICANCEYGLVAKTGQRICVRHNMYVSDTLSCPGYYNHRKELIYKQLIRNFTKEGK